MIDLFKKAMYAGVGMAVLTKEKVESNLREMVEKGKMTAEEAEELTEKIIASGKEETEQAKGEASRLFADMLHRAQVVTTDQLAAIEARVKALEGKWHREFPNDHNDNPA